MDAKDIATETAYNTYTVKKNKTQRQSMKHKQKTLQKKTTVINDDGSITSVVEEEVEEESVVEEEEVPLKRKKQLKKRTQSIDIEEPVEEESTRRGH